MDPPSYEESTEDQGHRKEEHHDHKIPQRFSIREEVGTSRAQHVISVVAKLLPLVQNRARGGYSRSTLLLLPSDQDCSRKGELVGYAEDEVPVLVQLEDGGDTVEFWRQPEALDLLRSQMMTAVSPTSTDHLPPLPTRPSLPPAARKTSLFGRKPLKSPEVQTVLKAPVTVDVKMEDVFFRTENEYGLYQTLCGRAVLLTVEVS
ncbi:hypothetical protein LTR56_006765 [Elasticomyces elasticus]|nr:hypothetical protein LTR22_015475 [Elasticomyces elasticus]KAK3649582.1 hypothetical protein LTR56_006765 [Elasticomyces elasticus]KAK4915094.1 hypothetical protein LTR49_016722 [Elasticomyces elasticus]KAK4961699.1 hypothetical protein LTR10_002190 [Elasticomyces elasticus]KAK4973736.1 hypothetical protein LTR42_005725 [Elasticomyces elasticus]